MTAEAGSKHRDDLVSGAEAGDTRADGLDDARGIHAEHGSPGSEEADGEAGEQAKSLRDLAAAGAVVGSADGARVHPDEHLVGPGSRDGDILDLHDLGSAEAAVDGGPHDALRTVRRVERRRMTSSAMARLMTHAAPMNTAREVSSYLPKITVCGMSTMA